MVRKIGKKWILYSHKGKVLGKYNSKEEAIKREAQVNFFKHMKGK